MKWKYCLLFETKHVLFRSLASVFQEKNKVLKHSRNRFYSCYLRANQTYCFDVNRKVQKPLLFYGTPVGLVCFCSVFFKRCFLSPRMCTVVTIHFCFCAQCPVARDKARATRTWQYQRFKDNKQIGRPGPGQTNLFLNIKPTNQQTPWFTPRGSPSTASAHRLKATGEWGGLAAFVPAAGSDILRAEFLPPKRSFFLGRRQSVARKCKDKQRSPFPDRVTGFLVSLYPKVTHAWICK